MGKYRVCTRISIIKSNTKALSTSYLSLVERHFNRQPRVKPHYIKTIFLLSTAQGSHKEVVNIRKHDYSSMSDDLRNRALLFWLLQFIVSRRNDVTAQPGMCIIYVASDTASTLKWQMMWC